MVAVGGSLGISFNVFATRSFNGDSMKWDFSEGEWLKMDKPQYQNKQRTGFVMNDKTGLMVPATTKPKPSEVRRLKYVTCVECGKPGGSMMKLGGKGPRAGYIHVKHVQEARANAKRGKKPPRDVPKMGKRGL